MQANKVTVLQLTDIIPVSTNGTTAIHVGSASMSAYAEHHKVHLHTVRSDGCNQFSFNDIHSTPARLFTYVSRRCNVCDYPVGYQVEDELPTCTWSRKCYKLMFANIQNEKDYLAAAERKSLDRGLFFSYGETLVRSQIIGRFRGIPDKDFEPVIYLCRDCERELLCPVPSSEVLSEFTKFKTISKCFSGFSSRSNVCDEAFIKDSSSEGTFFTMYMNHVDQKVLDSYNSHLKFIPVGTKRPSSQLESIESFTSPEISPRARVSDMVQNSPPHTIPCEDTQNPWQEDPHWLSEFEAELAAMSELHSSN